MANGINRYYLPAQQPIIDTYVPLPFKEILMAGQAQQEAYDDLKDKIGTLEDKEFYAIDPYKDYVTNKQSELYSDVEGIYDAFSSGNFRSGRSKYQEAQRKWKRELNPLTGVTGKAMQDYDTRSAYSKALDEANPIQKKALLQYQDDLYAQKNKDIYNIKEMTGYSTEDAVKFVNSAEWALDKLQYIESSTRATASSRPDGQGYILTRKGTNEQVSEAEIASVLLGPNWQAVMQGDLSKLGGLAAGDPELKAHMEQGLKTGYFSVGELLNAIVGTAEAGSFIKQTRDEDRKQDWIYERALDKKDELEAGKSIQVTNPQTIENDRLAQTREIGWTPEYSVTGVKVFDKDMENLNTQKNSLQSEIEELAKIAADPYSTPAAIKAARVKIQGLNAQISDLDNEINKSNSYKESFIKTTYGIDNEYLAKNRFESATDYYNQLKEYESGLKQVVQETEGLVYELVNEANTNGKHSRTLRNIGTFYVKEDGSIAFIYDQGAGMKSEYLVKHQVKEELDRLNTMQQVLIAQPLEAFINENKDFNFKSLPKYDPNNHVASYNAIRKEIASKENALNTNSDFFITNRTYTTRQDIITPEMIKNNPTYQSIEIFANNMDFADFRKVDAKGDLVEYKPTMSEFDYETFGRTKNKLVLTGIDHTRDNGSQPTFNLVNKDGVILDTGILLDDSNTSIKKELNKYYTSIAKNSMETSPDGQPDGDAVIGIFSSSNEPAMRNAWTEVNNAMNELPTEFITGDNQEIALRKISGVGPGDAFYIGVDNVEDQNYIIFNKGITEKQIKDKDYGIGDFTLVPKSMVLPTGLDYSYDKLDSYILGN